MKLGTKHALAELRNRVRKPSENDGPAAPPYRRDLI